MCEGRYELLKDTAKTYVVQAGKTVDLAVGSPVAAGFTIRVQGRTVTFAPDLKDATGAKIHRLVLAGGKRPKAPGLEIFDADGKRVYKASLTYG